MLIAERTWTTEERISPAYAPFKTIFREEVVQDSATSFRYRRWRNSAIDASFSDGLARLDDFMAKWHELDRIYSTGG